MGSMLKQIWNRNAQELWIYAALVFCIYVLYYFKRYIRIYHAAFRVDGPAITSILGNMNYIIEKDSLNRLAQTAFQTYGRVFRFWLLFWPMFVILDPEDIQSVLYSSKNLQKTLLYEVMTNSLGNGLVTLDVETWKSHRKLLRPAFRLQILQQFIGSFAMAAHRLTDKFQRNSGQNINLTKFLNDTVFEILQETVLGAKVSENSRKDDESEVDNLFKKGTISTQRRLNSPWLLVSWIDKMTSSGKMEKQESEHLITSCHRIIEEKRQLRKNKIDHDEDGSVKSLLEFLLDVSDKHSDILTDEDVANECCTFMVGGHESVSTATAITIFLLANNPEWQEKCIDELHEIFKDDTRIPTMQDLQMLRCLEMFIKESLRLYPTVPIIARTLGEDVKVGKHVIPIGSHVAIIPYGTHRLPHHFSEPNEFRPERFNSENSGNRHPCAYLPFSLGARNCIGSKFADLEMKVLISTILRRFELSPVPGKTELQPKYRVPTIRARGGLWVKITDRPKR